MTWNEPEVVRPPPSVTLHFTVVVVRAKVEPEGGAQLGVGAVASSASVAVALNEAGAPPGPIASTVRSAGRKRLGGVFGTTSILKTIEVDFVRPVVPLRDHDIVKG